MVKRFILLLAVVSLLSAYVPVLPATTPSAHGTSITCPPGFSLVPVGANAEFIAADHNGNGLVCTRISFADCAIGPACPIVIDDITIP